MDLALSEEQQLIVDMVRRFVREEIVPLEETLDPDADALPPEELERLRGITREMGLYGLDTPPEYGGPEIDMVTRTLVVSARFPGHGRWAPGLALPDPPATHGRCAVSAAPGPEAY